MYWLRGLQYLLHWWLIFRFFLINSIITRCWIVVTFFRLQMRLYSASLVSLIRWSSFFVKMQHCHEWWDPKEFVASSWENLAWKRSWWFCPTPHAVGYSLLRKLDLKRSWMILLIFNRRRQQAIEWFLFLVTSKIKRDFSNMVHTRSL